MIEHPIGIKVVVVHNPYKPSSVGKVFIIVGPREFAFHAGIGKEVWLQCVSYEDGRRTNMRGHWIGFPPEWLVPLPPDDIKDDGDALEQKQPETA